MFLQEIKNQMLIHSLRKDPIEFFDCLNNYPTKHDETILLCFYDHTHFTKNSILLSKLKFMEIEILATFLKK